MIKGPVRLGSLAPLADLSPKDGSVMPGFCGSQLHGETHATGDPFPLLKIDLEVRQASRTAGLLTGSGREREAEEVQPVLAPFMHLMHLLH